MTVVVDSHVHVWDGRVLDYPWLAGTDPAGPHLPADVDGARVDDGARPGIPRLTPDR